MKLLFVITARSVVTFSGVVALIIFLRLVSRWTEPLMVLDPDALYCPDEVEPLSN